MRVVFAGTPSFAVPALEALVDAGHEVRLVLSQPDRPAGRGLKLSPSPISAAASRLGLPQAKPVSVKTGEAQELLRSVAPDVMVVAAYGLLLPQAVLDIPKRGCINIHASLLPRWRGAAPVHRAILAGDASSGVSIMRMEAGLDTGPVLLAKPQPILPSETTGTLTDKLARLGAEALIEALAHFDGLKPRAQDPALATYAAKITKAEATIDWSQNAGAIGRLVRAFNPAPGADGLVRRLPLKIWEAEPLARGDLEPGAVVVTAGSVSVGCGSGAIELRIVQRPGGRRMAIGEFLRGNPWADAPVGTATT